MSVAGCDGHWDIHEMVCDKVHHDYPGSCPSVLQRFPTKSADHLTGTAGGPIVSSCKSCRPLLDSFQLLGVGLCVVVP